MSQDQPNRDVLALRRLEAEIANGRIQVYRNLLGQPYVYFDIDGKIIDDTHPAVHLHLFHDDVRAWLTQFIWKAEGVLLHQRELDRVLQALAGLSLREKVEQVTDPALLELLENEPTIAVIVEFMHAEKRRKLEESMEVLWKTLREFGQERGLLVRGKNRFPGGANVLSRKLNRFKEQLRRFNIKITTIRSNGCRIILERLDDPLDQSSAESSAPNPTASGVLPTTDPKNSMRAVLAAKRRQQTNPTPPTEGSS